MKSDRRAFVSGGGLALAAVAAGTITGLSSGEALAQDSGASPRIASFGWEITNLNNNGADVYFRVVHAMLLNSVNIDTAFMITGPPSAPNFAEVLCQAAFSKGVPKFAQGPAAYFATPASPDFGKVQVYNPNNTDVAGQLNIGFNGVLSQNVFYSVILKTWVPADGTASATSRHVAIAPSLPLVAGDYLAFHMDHAGTPGDAEMQVVLQYMLG